MLVFFFIFALLFIGAVFDIDWILKFTRGDRSYGRTFARIFYGSLGFFVMVMMLFAMLSQI
ncbi:MAG: hypothetical protein H6652_14465 [Ardenticatenaceae bacterium]|nr:hypothetical protein [Ardenticatenaceae bacterium]MCB8947635.1 hypothetical protein [Ardenticatenaceae bacterium]